MQEPFTMDTPETALMRKRGEIYDADYDELESIFISQRAVKPHQENDDHRLARSMNRFFHDIYEGDAK